jgi:branched-chain amino acid transport system ATP-binding protein
MLQRVERARPPTDRAPLLEIDDLHVAYGKAEVLHGASLCVHEGEFVSILGRNGAGKSTLLNAISGLIPKRSGHVRFAGQDIAQATPHAIVRAGLVQVLEGHRIFPSLTVEDNILMGMYGKHGRVQREKLERMYALFPEIAEKRRQPASRLSGGQQEILAVAQGMVADPKLLVLDEPSGGLAPVVVDRILDVAVSLCETGVAILLVEQLVEKALSRSDRCYLMETGRMIHSGPAAEILGSDILHRAFFGGHVA